MMPKSMVYVQSECKVLGDKWKSVLSNESHHSKWEDFRRLAKTGSSTEECSILLRRMELEESDKEEEEMEHEEQQSLEEIGLGFKESSKPGDQLLEQQADEQQKRKVQWGPTQRIPRPRRFPEDGKITMQRTQKLKSNRTYKVLNL